MSYTYTPGTRPDALSILRDKGLLDTPARLDPKPGTYVLGAAGHFRIREDGTAERVKPRVAVTAIEVLPAYPAINLRSLGWILVVLVICAFLLGLLAVGSK